MRKEIEMEKKKRESATEKARLQKNEGKKGDVIKHAFDFRRPYVFAGGISV